MLNTIDERPQSKQTGVVGFVQHLPQIEAWSFDRVYQIALRRRYVIAGGVIAGLILAATYTLVAVPRYTATLNILIDQPKVRAIADISDGGNSISLDTGSIDSQVELLKSERLAAGVIKKLDLRNNKIIGAPTSSLATTMVDATRFARALLGLSDPPSRALPTEDAEARVDRRILAYMARNIDVKRVAKSYVIEIRFTSEDPALAAQIANAIAEQYLVDQLDAKYDATSRAALWLQDRIQELRDRSIAADTKVQKFRSEKGLITADGKLVNEQSLKEATTQLSEARARVAETEAKANRIDAIMKSGSVDAAVAEALNNPVIAQLRTKYLDASRREADLSKKLGENHIAAVNFRNEMKQYERLVFDELGRIGESYRSDYQIAKSRLESIEQNFSDLKALSASTNETLVQLRELERESDTYKSLYQTFLQRYQEAIQQQSFPINDARVITPANPFLSASWPRTNLLLALGLMAGGTAGAIGALLLEFRDRTFRTGEQVQSELGLEFLGLLPVVETARMVRSGPGREGQTIGNVPPELRYSISAPLSGFAETLRASKVAADIALRGKRSKVIGTISVMPGEGKTTVSKNLASMVASLGTRAVLIDGDFRNPGLTRSLTPDVDAGVVEILNGTRSFEEVVLTEPESGLSVVPAIIQRRITNSSELLSSAAMRLLLERLGERYDYIFIDLPPIGPVIDVRAAVDLIDAFVFVVEWGKTPRGLVKSTLDTEAEIADKCLGVLLNKVDKSKMHSYEGHAYRNYYYKNYSNYYTS